VQVQNWCRCPNKTTLHAHSRCRAMQCGNLGPSSIEQSREKAQRHNRHHAFNIICHATSKCSFDQRQVQHTETATSNRVRVGQQSHRRHRSLSKFPRRRLDDDEKRKPTKSCDDATDRSPEISQRLTTSSRCGSRSKAALHGVILSSSTSQRHVKFHAQLMLSKLQKKKTAT
jgi:hypothetical protein